MPASAMRLAAPGGWSSRTYLIGASILPTPTLQYLARYWFLGSSVVFGGVAVRVELGYATVTKDPESNEILVSQSHEG